MATLDKAILIAVHAHQGQKDRYGGNYILHPLRVMFKVDSDDEKIVAILHDVVEKTSWTIEKLQKEGFSEDVLVAVDLLTRRKSQPYMVYIEKLKGNPLARRVKIADLEDNLNPQRMNELSQSSFKKLTVLHKAWKLLKKAGGTHPL